tara:strand:+ start:1957 stop:2118 length:162 start_codon:yes stop_codon:yes gene_type:complete
VNNEKSINDMTPEKMEQWLRMANRCCSINYKNEESEILDKEQLQKKMRSDDAQ